MKKIKQFSFVLFIFSVLGLPYFATSVSAQDGIVCEQGQFDVSLTCDPTTGTCCNQCDPGSACNAADPHAIPCCSSGDNNMSNGNVTLDPNIDLGSPAPSGNVTLDPNIDPQQNKIPNMKGIDLGTAKHAPNPKVKPNMKGIDLGTSKHAPNPKVKPNMKGIDLGTSEDSAARNVIPNVQGQVQVQQHEQNQETTALHGQWISCGAIRADIAGKLDSISSDRSYFPTSILHAGCGPHPQYKVCVETHFSPGWPGGDLMNRMRDEIREIKDFINDRC